VCASSKYDLNGGIKLISIFSTVVNVGDCHGRPVKKSDAKTCKKPTGLYADIEREGREICAKTEKELANSLTPRRIQIFFFQSGKKKEVLAVVISR
jgi:hypothetical protein